MRLIKYLVLSAALAALPALPVLASLGGDLSSVQADRAHMKGALRVSAAATSASTGAAFTVHEISTAYGMTVREYARSDGKVFAVTWAGPANPDLRQVLGSYYEQFVQAAEAAPPNHRHLVIRQSGLVVENHGRLRAMGGRAWAPALLPANFATDQIK